MLNPQTEKVLNEQMNREMASFYLYLAMSAELESHDFRGMASWMHTQAKEEFEHAMKFFGYIQERGGKVALDAIAKPHGDWVKPLAVFEAALKHEHFITANINDLMNQAVAEKDHATAGFLQFFVKEQVEEEANVEPIVRKLKVIGDQIPGLFYVDRELGMRGK